MAHPRDLAHESPPAPSLGKLLATLASRFELRGRLGSGSMGVVYRAFDRALGREVALKTLRAHTPELLHHLKEEFRAASSVVHPNLIELHELFVQGSECFFTMELLDGAPFDRAVRHGWAATPGGASSFASAGDPDAAAPSWTESGMHRVGAALDEARAVSELSDPAARLASGAAQLVRAVAALHDAGHVHCDIKPSNVLVTGSGRVVVLDFGLASPRWGQLVRPGFSGTLAYAAPEQLWSGELTAATDWYAVGVVLFQALTGELPDRDGQLQAQLARAWDALPPESQVRLPEQFGSLVSELLRLEPARRPGRERILAVLDRPRESVRPQERKFVGRAAELEALHGALRAASAGWLTAVNVWGDSGIGKTELIRQFTLQAMDEDALVVRGQCRLDESVPYQALDHVIDDLSQHLSLLPIAERSAFLPDDFASLARVFPVLGGLARTEPLPEELDVATVRHRAIAGLRQLLWRLCAWRPLILWVDDAHWGDAESQSLLCELLREPAPPFLLILSHREASAQWVAPVAQATVQAHGQWIELPAGPLDEASSRELVSHLLGRLSREHPALARRVATASEHVPLFIGQLCRLVAEAPSEQPCADERLTLVDVIERRVGQLDAEARRLAEMVALIEAPLPVRVVAAAAELSPDNGRLVSRLAAAQLLRLTGARPDPRLVSFHHHVRETLLTRLDPASRQRMHRRLAAALEQLDPTIVPEVLLHHWIEAGERGRALEVALEAARAAQEKLAFAHAAALFRSALGLLEPSSARHVEVQVELARALSAAGRSVEAGEQWRQLSERTSEPESLRCLQRAAEAFLIGGRLDTGMAVLAQALRRAGVQVPASTARLALGGLRRLLALRLTSRSAARERDSRAELEVDLCLGAAKGLGLVEPLLSAYFSLAALDAARRAGDPLRTAAASCLSGMVLAALGGPLGRWGREWLADAAQLAEASGDVLARASVLVCEAQVELSGGRWSSTLRRCEAATRSLVLRPEGGTWELNMAEVAALRALEETGELIAARQRAAAWQAGAQQRGDLYAQTTATLYLAQAQLADDAPDRAQRMAELALEPWSAAPPAFQEFYRLRVHAQAALYRARPREALELAERAHQVLRAARLDKLPMAVLELSLLGVRAHLQVMRAGSGSARTSRECRRGIARLERLGRPDAGAWAALSRAALAALEDDSTRAHALLEAARAGFAENQMSLGEAYVAVASTTLAGGGGAAEQRAAAVLNLTQRGILAPRSWLRAHAPGFALPEPTDPSWRRPPPA